MPAADLHLFVDDLKSGASGTSNKPPRSIRAKDLDDNFLKAAVIADIAEPNSYTVQYGTDGTVLKIFPSINESDTYVLQTVSGQLQWTSTPTINASGTYVLGTVDGVLQWIATQDCDA